MKLRYDPYQIFTTSKTPAGLYARQKWLGQEGCGQWKTDYEETVAKLTAYQTDDGSWKQSETDTIMRLFGLHLTVRKASTDIDAALNWLLNKISLRSIENNPDTEVERVNESLEGLPFVRSRRDLFLIGTTLFLASIFGRDDDPSVLAVYRWLTSEGLCNKGLWFDRASSHNIIRAMVVHPVYSKHPATILAVESLASIQSASGEWDDGLPFCQTLNALAHLNTPDVDKQLEKAFLRLSETQNADGSWSESEPEWNTFLAVHAMKNKGLI